MIPSREIIAYLRSVYPIGTRLELVSMDDPQAPPVGTRGTVRGVDDIGSILMHWDNGSGLSLLFGEDNYIIIPLNPIQLIFQNGTKAFYQTFTQAWDEVTQMVATDDIVWVDIVDIEKNFSKITIRKGC